MNLNYNPCKIKFSSSSSLSLSQDRSTQCGPGRMTKQENYDRNTTTPPIQRAEMWYVKMNALTSNWQQMYTDRSGIMGYCELWITSCLCIVVVGSKDDLATTKLRPAASVFCFVYLAVNHEENLLCDCELFNSSWYWSGFEREMTIKPPVFRHSLFTPCNWMHTTRNWSHICRVSIHHQECICMSF